MKAEDAFRYVARVLEARAVTSRREECMPFIDATDVQVIVAEALRDVAGLLSVEERT